MSAITDARTRRRSTVVALLVLATLAVGLPRAEAGPRADFVKRLINRQRREVGSPVLRSAGRLSRAARLHSRRMARSENLHHNPRLRRAVGDRWDVVGENVGRASERETLRKTLRDLHRLFMRSAPHRRNIRLRSYRRLGVGITRSGGSVWITIVFAG